jgi:hypothetical protein
MKIAQENKPQEKKVMTAAITARPKRQSLTISSTLTARDFR